MAEPQAEAPKEIKKEKVHIDLAQLLRKGVRILFSRFVLKTASCVMIATILYSLGTHVPKVEKPADLVLPADTSLENILLASLGAEDSSQILAAESSSIVAYAVQAGDTLDKISRKYKISAEKLAIYNNIEDARKLFPGMVLRIPL